MAKRLQQGNTWIPSFTITADSTAMDCTDYTVKMFIKSTLSETATATQELEAAWTNRPTGQGYFTLTNAMSKDMIGRYWYEIILYKTADASVVATLERNRLIIIATLEKDF